MDYRLNKEDLLEAISTWNGFLRRKIHLIACGGTALTFIGVKDSTKDVDLIVPVDSEYKYLTRILNELGYKQITAAGWSRGDQYVFDLFCGKTIHTTELLESPLKEDNHIFLREYSRIYVGILNFYDLITSKLMRGTAVDFQDCFTLVKIRKDEIDSEILTERFLETSKYDVSEERANKNLEHFLKTLKRKGIYE
jgi:hypothetical protein